MRHEQTVIIMLYFKKSKSKVNKAVKAINAIMDSKSISLPNKMHMFLPILEEPEMNQFFFVKNKNTNKFEQVNYDIVHFDILKWNEYEIEFRFNHDGSIYCDGSVLFTLPQKKLFIVKH